MPSKRWKKEGMPRKSTYILPNLVTSGSLFSGFVAIIMASEGAWQTAAIAIFVSLLLDGLDGKVARLTKSTSNFGVEYDSLADVVAFGVAPAFLAYHFVLSDFGRLGWVAGFLYVCCGALRLARFNVQVGSTDPRYFVGLPIPAAASTLAATILAMDFFGIGSGKMATGMLILVYVLSFLMVSNLPYRSLKKVDLRKCSPFNILVAGVLLLSIVAYQPVLMAIIFWGAYLLSGPAVALYRLRLRNAKQGALEDTGEPEVASRR